MSTAPMASIKRDPKTLEIANAILEQYDCQTVEDMQNAFKDIFGPIFESMLQGEMMSQRDIAETIDDIYGFKISHETISAITDRVIETVEEWHSKAYSVEPAVEQVLYLLVR